MFRSICFFICIVSLPKIVFGQLEGIYRQRTLGGLCSSTFKLFADSLYTHESGCESSSRFSIGRWKYLNDTVLFTPLDKKNFSLINNVTLDRDSLKKIRAVILDKNGVNITKKTKIVQLSQNKQYSMTLDSSGTTRSDYIRDEGVLLISQLCKPFGEGAKININSYNKIVITLNLTEQLLQSSKSVWYELYENKYLIMNDELRVNIPEWLFNSETDQSQYIWIKE